MDWIRTFWKTAPKPRLKRTLVLILGIAALCLISSRQIKFHTRYEIHEERLDFYTDGNRTYLNCLASRMKSQTNLLKEPVPKYIKRYKNPCWKNNSHIHCIPYVHMVGVAKCGTTDLFKRICQHPDFIEPNIKETNWISFGLHGRGESIQNYAERFFWPLSRILENTNGGVKNRLITGEASINTMQNSMFWEHIGNNVGQPEPVEGNPEYIYHLFKHTKILFNLRNPIDRLWSEYLAFSRARFQSAEKFHNIVERSVRLYNKCIETSSLRSCLYNRTLSDFATMNPGERRSIHTECPSRKPIDIVNIRRGVYHVFIKDFLKVFPRDQILVQRLEDISKDPKSSLKKTYDFIGLRKLSEQQMDFIMRMGIRNRRKGQRHRHMWNQTRYLLYDFYKEHNRELAQLLGDEAFNYQIYNP